MKTISKILTALLFAILLFPLTTSLISADRGMIPVSDVSVYGPGQKAIIAWDGEEEIMILSTDVRASSDSVVLEVLPLPSMPQRIEAGDFSSFYEIEWLVSSKLPFFNMPYGDRLGGGGEGVEIVFHERIGAHDITVVEANSAQELIDWAEAFLGDNGIEHDISSPELEAMFGGYIEDGMGFFVFDLVDVTPDPMSIEPIIYQFRSDSLYYPLVISSLASGETEIILFLLTPGAVDLARLPDGMTVGHFDGQPVQFELDGDELEAIDPQIAELLGDSAWLTALRYEGDLALLESDLMVYEIYETPGLFFDYSAGSCAYSEEEAQIFVWGDEVLFSGSVTTPTPCYRLDAELIFPPAFSNPPLLVVDITPRVMPGVCVQCIGSIPFTGEIKNLDPGEYDVAIYCQGRLIAEETVEVPSLAEVPSIELPHGAILEINPIVERPIRINGTPIDFDAPVVEVITPLANIRVSEAANEAIIEVNRTGARTSEEIRVEGLQLYLGSSEVNIMPDEVLEAGLKPQVVYDIELKTIDGEPVYVTNGLASGRLLWLIPVDIEIETTIDAQSGEVIQEEAPWWEFLFVYHGSAASYYRN